MSQPSPAAAISPHAVRVAASAVVLLPVALLALGASPAAAETPEQWPDADNPSLLSALLLIVGVPILLFVLILVATYLPSMIRGQKYDAATAWRDPEWFGGPRQGVEAARGPAKAVGVGAPSEVSSSSETGGASAHW